MRKRAVFSLTPIILAMVALISVAGGGSAAAQSSSIEEAVNRDGAAQKLELTPAWNFECTCL